jgi:hypothetical protein
MKILEQIQTKDGILSLIQNNENLYELTLSWKRDNETQDTVPEILETFEDIQKAKTAFFNSKMFT